MRLPRELFDVLVEPMPCQRCDGDGWERNKAGVPIDCRRCAGSGEEPEPRRKR